jgi:hypothetical protein
MRSNNPVITRERDQLLDAPIIVVPELHQIWKIVGAPYAPCANECRTGSRAGGHGMATLVDKMRVMTTILILILICLVGFAAIGADGSREAANAKARELR